MTIMFPIASELLEMSEKLSSHGFTVLDTVPSNYEKPFVVVGTHTDTPVLIRHGHPITNLRVQLDYYISTSEVSRIEVENLGYKFLQALNERDTTKRLVIDNSTGQEVYHWIFEVQKVVTRWHDMEAYREQTK